MVVGAGIGGLTAGIALRQAGVDAVVFERATDLAKVQVGGGLHMWPNAMLALRQLGLDEAARGVGEVTDVVRFAGWRGNVISELDVGAVGRSLGTQTVGVRRAGLHRVLAEALGQDALVLGAGATGFTQDEGGVTLQLGDGREERGDLLVGADGQQSVIRQALLGPEPLRYAGYTSWIALSDSPPEQVDDGVLTVTWGRGARFIYYRVDGGRLAWIANATAPEGESDDGRRKKTVAEVFGGWAEPVPTIIASTDETRIARSDLYDRKPVKRWGTGRVTLLGDAAHPMTPNIAQGACQAIEDALVLTKALTTEHDVIVAALRGYENRRIARTTPIVKRAHAIGRIADWQHPLACAVRDFGLKMGRRPMIAQETKLYSHRV